ITEVDRRAGPPGSALSLRQPRRPFVPEWPHSPIRIRPFVPERPHSSIRIRPFVPEWPALSVERDFDQRALLDHPPEVLAAPVARDVGKDLSAFRLVFYDPSRPRQVRSHFPLELTIHHGLSPAALPPAPPLRLRD